MKGSADAEINNPVSGLKESKASANGSSGGSEKLTCVDLFAGCGGLSLGLEMAGFETLLFSELNHHAAKTFMANRVGHGEISWK